MQQHKKIENITKNWWWYDWMSTRHGGDVEVDHNLGQIPHLVLGFWHVKSLQGGFASSQGSIRSNTSYHLVLRIRHTHLSCFKKYILCAPSQQKQRPTIRRAGRLFWKATETIKSQISEITLKVHSRYNHFRIFSFNCDI